MMKYAATLALTIGSALAVTSVDAQQVDEIVVTSRKTAERLQDVPLSVSAFSSQRLEETGARDIFDLTRLTPGFSFERLNRYGVQGGVSRSAKAMRRCSSTESRSRILFLLSRSTSSSESR
jgi:outer membrane receptor protein involved in Fe transport